MERLKKRVSNYGEGVRKTWACYYVGVVLKAEQEAPLGLEMGFLGTFLEYAAPNFIHIQNLKPLLMRAHELYFQALIFLVELPVVRESSEWSMKMMAEWATPAAYTLHEVKLLNLEITQVYSILSQRLLHPISYARLNNFIKSLLRNIEILLQPYVVVDGLLRIQLDALKEKLKFLENSLMLIRGRWCHEPEGLTHLINYATFLAYNAAYLCHSCFISRTLKRGHMDKDIPQLLDEYVRPHRLASHLSQLVREFDPAVSPQARQIYIAALQASSEYLPSPALNASLSNTDAVDFLESLVQNVRQLLFTPGWTILTRDQIQNLLAELTFLTCFLRQPPYLYVHRETLDLLLSQSRIISTKAGSMVYTLFDNEMNEKTLKVVCSSLVNLVKEIQSIKAEVKAVSDKLLSMVQFPKFPRTHELGSLDRFLQNLRESLNNSSSSIRDFDLPIEALLEELQILKLFLSKINGQQLKQLWSHTMEVACKAEYMVDSILASQWAHHFFVGSHWPQCFFVLWLAEVHKEIHLLQAEVDEIGDVGVGEIQNDEEISRQASLQTNFVELNEVTVGFEDVEERIIEDLRRGSRNLQMVAIIGMGGQGKTHLANKIYNKPVMKRSFDVCAWCYVSPKCHRSSLLACLLSQIQNSINTNDGRRSEQELAEALYRSLKGRRYFIVMDDLWDAEACVALKRSFPDDKTGSRIMYTSRQNLDFGTLGITPHLHFLDPLTDEESWQLLQKRIFGRESCPLELLEVGKQIAKACKGLPLAVVVTAGILARNDKKPLEWSEIAGSLSSYILHDKGNKCK